MIKLNAVLVQMILEAKGKFSADEIAEAFDVSKYTIYEIWEGRSWREVEVQGPMEKELTRRR